MGGRGEEWERGGKMRGKRRAKRKLSCLTFKYVSPYPPEALEASN